MKIKNAEGQTLLSLVRLAIVSVACLCVAGAAAWADWAFGAAGQAGDLVGDILHGEAEAQAGGHGQPTVLYYSEQDENGGQIRVYQVFYITGGENAHGLTDAAGQVLLPEQYQDVVVLPRAYLLRQNDNWRFYDRDSLQPLSEDSWDWIEVLRSESGRFISDLLAVGRDGLYGAVDMQGRVVIEPVYEYFQLSSLQADWPLIRVRQNGLYGFINAQGQVVVSLSYDYAALDTVTVHADENDAEGVETPLVYVLKGEDWGALYRVEGGGSGEVDWSVEPTGEVMSAWRQEI